MELIKRMELLSSSDSSETLKANLLTDLTIYYDYPSKDEKAIAVLIAKQLIDYLIHEKNSDLRDLAIGALVVLYHNKNVCEETSLEPIVNSLQNYSVEEVSGILVLLGYSGKQEYIPLIKKYTNVIPEEVEDALLEISYRNSEK